MRAAVLSQRRANLSEKFRWQNQLNALAYSRRANISRSMSITGVIIVGDILGISVRADGLVRISRRIVGGSIEARRRLSTLSSRVRRSARRDVSSTLLTLEKKGTSGGGVVEELGGRSKREHTSKALFLEVVEVEEVVEVVDGSGVVEGEVSLEALVDGVGAEEKPVLDDWMARGFMPTWRHFLNRHDRQAHRTSKNNA